MRLKRKKSQYFELFRSKVEAEMGGDLLREAVLIGLGIPEYVVKRYEDSLKDGGILLSVHTDDSKWRDKAKDILKTAGASDISEGVKVGLMMLLLLGH